jgi:type IX secretion system PorP/SprF family membrane protein
LALPMHGQLMPFAQYNYADPMLISAKIGSDDNMEATLIHQNQGLAGGDNLFSTLVYGKYPIVNRSNNRLTLAISYAENRVNGPGALNVQQFSSSLAYGFKLDKTSNLSFAMDVGLITKSVDLSGIYTGNMWLPGLGFDPSISTGEPLESTRLTYPKLNTSLYYVKEDKNNDDLLRIGLAVQQLNAVKDQFYNPDSEETQRHIILEGGIRVYERDRLALMPTLLTDFTTGSTYVTVGMGFNYGLHQFRNQVSRENNSLNFDLNYKIQKGLQMALQFIQPHYVVGMAYHWDLNSNVENRVYNNALEVLIRVKNPVPTRTARKTTKRNKQKEQQKIVEPEISGDNEKSITLIDSTKSDEIIEMPISEEEIVVEEIGQSSALSEMQQDWHVSLGLGSENTLNFAFNSTTIDEKSYFKLQEIAKTMKAYSGAKIVLVGHTDDQGSTDINEAFSIERANAAKSILIELGVPEDHIYVQGMGEKKPLADNSSEEGRRQNRRIEYHIIE